MTAASLSQTGSSPVTRSIGLVAARSKSEAHALAADVEAWLTAHGCEVLSEARLGEPERPEVEAIVVLGGDGLMMRAANTYPDIPLLGINFGKVGFLALVERRDWQSALQALIDGRFQIDDGSTLSAVLSRGDETIDQGWAINDVVIRGGIRMVDIEVHVDNYYVNTYPGDGMIVATPHGSTAYCMAAGGPILTAGVRGVAIVPISCHSPIRTPLVVPEDGFIELVLANDHQASLILDGRAIMELRQGDVIQVSRGPHSFRLITLSTTNFYEAFRTKFNFRIRPDAVPTRRNGRSRSANLAD